ncbi:MAG: arsinothricin resistance N-acetyltransferase ArsN1 family B [Pseudomonadota bacterium]
MTDAGDIFLRQATPGDGTAVAAIYRPIVEQTAISFEEVPPSADDMAGRIAQVLEHYPYLVAAQNDRVIGYAYPAQHMERAAYRWSVNVSAYVAEGFRGAGVGRRLYEALFETLAERGFHMAMAGITLPNEASVKLHEGMGFRPVGVYREVGFKFGRWHDVGWWQRRI